METINENILLNTNSKAVKSENYHWTIYTCIPIKSFINCVIWDK